jgi:hypothetical protein
MIEPDNSNSGSSHITIIHIDCIIYAAYLMSATRAALFVD